MTSFAGAQAWLTQELGTHLIKDLFTYCSDGMGWPLHEQPHREMCTFLEENLPPVPSEMADAAKKYAMLLMPRETLKTTVGAQGLAEYFLIKWKKQYGYDGRVAIVRANREASRTVLNAVREDLSKGNPVLQKAFGNLSVDSPIWTVDQITLNWRSQVYREPSILTSAPGTPLTGMHVDLIIIDDIANEINYMSETEMTKARNYIQALDPVLNSWGSMVVIGTRWGFNDPYGWIIDNDNRLMDDGHDPQWDKLIKSCYNEDGTLLYPAFLTEAKIERYRRNLDEKLFTAWYLNDVIQESSRTFQSQYLRYFDGEYSPADTEPAELTVSEGHFAGYTFDVRCTMHVDPATTVGEHSNFSAYHVVLTDAEDPENYWIWKSWKGKEVPSNLILRLLADCRFYVPEELSIDVLGQQVLWVDRLQDALRDAGLKTRITQYKGKTHDEKVGRGMLGKAQRIEALEPLFREGRIIVRRGTCATLLHEYAFYSGVTKSNHFDSLDALGHIRTCTSKPRSYAARAMGLEKLEMDMEAEDEVAPPKIRARLVGR